MDINPLKYVIDTCSFTALQRVYPIDVFPGVWNLVEKLAENGIIGSVDDVMEELKLQDDFLYRWAKNHKNIFLPLDAEIQTQATTILSTHEKLVDLKKRKSGADPFIIAMAVVKSTTLVTEEKPSGGPQKVKIPDVCKAYRVPCITILDLLRTEGLILE